MSGETTEAAPAVSGFTVKTDGCRKPGRNDGNMREKGESAVILESYELGRYYRHLESCGLVRECSADQTQMQQKIEHLTFDSRDVRKNTLFICKGAHFRPEYLEAAVKAGAAAYISEIPYDTNGTKDVPHIIVSDIRAAMAEAAGIFYRHITDKLHLIGITGTKGKSTTAFFVKSIIDEYMSYTGGRESAVLSGIINYDGVISEESHLTTPESFDIYRHICNAADCGIEYLTMEVSSQGLKYDRTRGLMFDIGCFLNIGKDHISSIEHSSFEDYLASKLKLFSQSRTICINTESDKIETITAAAEAVRDENEKKGIDIPQIITFGHHSADDYRAYDISSIEGNSGGIAFSVKAPDFDERFEISMRGLFNVDNALAAVTITSCLGMPAEFIKRGLKKAYISGRMEFFKSRERGCGIIVDYAHNKMSFEALFRSVRAEMSYKKIFIVFGCPGGKAQNRRQELGEIAGRYADRIYLTEEDAGEEPVGDICREIARCIGENGCAYEIIEDRGEAIRAAVNAADSDTLILITGKGRETRQKRGTDYVETPSDVDYVQEIIRGE